MTGLLLIAGKTRFVEAEIQDTPASTSLVFLMNRNK